MSLGCGEIPRAAHETSRENLHPKWTHSDLKTCCTMLTSVPQSNLCLVMTFNSLGLSQSPKWQKPLYSKRFTSCLKTAVLTLSFGLDRNRSSVDILKQLSLAPGRTPPGPHLSVFSSGTDTSFVSFAELDYRNSYEIEYMEKIGSPLPVSSFPSHRLGDWLSYPVPCPENTAQASSREQSIPGNLQSRALCAHSVLSAQ